MAVSLNILLYYRQNGVTVNALSARHSCNLYAYFVNGTRRPSCRDKVDILTHVLPSFGPSWKCWISYQIWKPARGQLPSLM